LFFALVISSVLKNRAFPHQATVVTPKITRQGFNTGCKTWHLVQRVIMQ
jgi:hypothetical protein